MTTMISTKKAIAALFLSAGLVSTAWATPYSLDRSVNAGNFAETYTFTVANGYTASLFGNLSTAYDLFSDIPAVYGVNVSSISLSGGGLTSSFTLTDDDVLGDSSWLAYTKTFNFSALNLTAGSYTLTVNGKAFTNGNYLGSFAVSATALPVPEPETFGMMMLGLGLVGLTAYRRKNA